MTREESTWLAYKKLHTCCEENTIAEPPCYREHIGDIYHSYMQTGMRSSRETHSEKLRKDFPDIPAEDRLKLVAYCKAAEDYFTDVCCAFAVIYPSVRIPATDRAQEDILLVTDACQKRYPWISSAYIRDFLAGVVAMCNR